MDRIETLTGVIAASVPFLLGGLWLGNIEGRVNSHDQRITVVEAAPVAIGKLEQNQENLNRQLQENKQILLAEVEKLHKQIEDAREVQDRTLQEVIAAREKIAAQGEVLRKRGT